MTDRTHLHFSEYNQFFDKAVTKQRLAQLCVSLNKLLVTWDDYGAQVLLNSKLQWNNANELVAKLGEINKTHINNMTGILDPIYTRRCERKDSKGSTLPKLKIWHKSADIFNNVVDSLTNDSHDELAELNSAISKLEEALGKGQSEVDRLKHENNTLKLDFQLLKK